MYLIDWSFRGFPPAQEVVAARLAIPVRNIDYFTAILCHEGLHPMIAEHADERLHALQPGDVGSLNAFRSAIQTFEESANPLRRPAALGLSMTLFTRDGGSPSALVALRSNEVAMNPGTWSTPVDEGVHDVAGFPDAILRPALDDELRAPKEMHDKLLRNKTCLGFHVPDPDTAGVKAGGNVLYVVEVDSVAELDEIAGLMAEASECAGAKVVEVDQALSDEVMLQSMSAALRHTLRMLNEGAAT